MLLQFNICLSHFFVCYHKQTRSCLVTLQNRIVMAVIRQVVFYCVIGCGVFSLGSNGEVGTAGEWEVTIAEKKSKYKTVKQQ